MKLLLPAKLSFLHADSFSGKFLPMLVCLQLLLACIDPAHGLEKIYSIHIKTVNSLELAEQTVSDLEQKGYKGFYRHMPSFEEGIQYRVFVGKYASKAQALETLNNLWNSDISNQYAIAVLRDEKVSPDKSPNPAEPVKAKKPLQSQRRHRVETKSPAQKPPPVILSNEKKIDADAKAFGKAIQHFHDNQYEKALTLFNQLSEDLSNPDILFWTGICESKLGNYGQAVEKLELLLATEPNTPQVMLELAAVLFKQKRDHDALAMLEKAKAFQPPADMQRHIDQMTKQILKKDDGFSLSFDFLIKKKKTKQASEKPESTPSIRKPPRKFYQIGSKSEDLLRSVQQFEPDNTAVSYYLGYIYVRKGKLADGIREWKKYLAKAQKNNRSIDVRKQLSLLLLKHAAIYSVNTPHTTKRVPDAQQHKRIVIAEFRNRCFSNVTGMGKGLAAMIRDDLQKIDTIQPLDRTIIHTITRRLYPGQHQISAPRNAAALGKALASQYTVWGEFTDISENAFHLMSTITENQHAGKIGTIDIKGTREEFYILEKRMVFGILESIGIHKKDLIPATLLLIEKPHTRNFDAFLSYSLGLEHLDKQQFHQAREAFYNAIQLDSNFELAENALHATPTDIFFCPFFEQTEIFIQGNQKK